MLPHRMVNSEKFTENYQNIIRVTTTTTVTVVVAFAIVNLTQIIHGL